MGPRFYLSFLFNIAVCFSILFILGFAVPQIDRVKEKKELLKKTVKLDALTYISHLNTKLNLLENDIRTVLQKQKLSPLSPFSKLILFDKASSNPMVYPQSSDDLELLELLDLENKSLFLSSNIFHFEKMKWKNKQHSILIKSDSSRLIIVFLKKSHLKKLQKKLIAVSFAAFNENQDFFFYSIKPQDLGKKNSFKFINSFLKDSSSKYITVKSKNKKKHFFYYLQEWKGTNLLFIVKKDIYPDFFDFLMSEKQITYLILFFALAILAFFIFLSYSKTALIVKAYSFLKTAFISFSETGQFPKASSKNPLLFFYRNRQELLNELEKQDDEPKTKRNIQLKELIKQELQKLKSSQPNLIIKEVFQTDIRLFGFERFLKIIVRELLLNAVESMGAMKEQKIDISIKEEKEYLVLSIKDYGIGLKDTKKAFQLYHSTKSQLGAGLNLVQSIVTANQGKIELITQEGGGLEAIVQIPLKCFLKK